MQHIQAPAHALLSGPFLIKDLWNDIYWSSTPLFFVGQKKTPSNK